MFAFGRNKGKTFSHVIENDVQYALWALKQKNPQALYDEMAGKAEKMRGKARSVS